MKDATIPVSVALLRDLGRLVDAVVNAEECLCDEMIEGRCLYCRASEIQDRLMQVLPL